MDGRVAETLVGAVVLIVAAAFFVYAYARSEGIQTGGYELVASFDQASGVTRGTDVRLSGIKVGQVADMSLDLKTYFARLTLAINPDIKLPEDSSIRIATEGLLGGTYLSIEPGASDTMMQPGGEFLYTQGAVDLIGLLGQAVFSSGQGNQSAPGGSPSPGGSPGGQ